MVSVMFFDVAQTCDLKPTHWNHMFVWYSRVECSICMYLLGSLANLHRLFCETLLKRAAM